MKHRTSKTRGVNQKQLYVALKKNRYTNPFFEGTYARDTLEDICSKPQLVICNTDVSSGKGIHWVLFFFEGDNVEFYDSLGQDLSVYGEEFITFVNKFARTYECSNKRTQPKDSALCGIYCLYYAFWRCRGMSMEDIITSMTSAKKVVKIVRLMFKLCKMFPCVLLQSCLPL